jgi:hypothetical protein
MARWFGFVRVVLLAALVAACSSSSASGGRPSTSGGDYLATLGAAGYGKYLQSSFAPTESTESGWKTYRYDTSELKCISCGEYYVMARPGTEADKTVLFLEGGGSCWPGHEDCATEATYYSDVGERGLASSDPRNPVRGWNFIYVPYCDGSLHMGDADADYDGDGVIDHWHWGLKTTSAAVLLMKELFPNSSRILIAGRSAGGEGTIGTAPVVRLAFPQASLYVFDDSGPGLVPAERRADLELIKRTWNIDRLFPADCPVCADQAVNLFSWLLERDSRLKVGLYSSYGDQEITSGWGITPQAFQTLLVETTDAIHQSSPDRFERYFVAGSAHTVSDYSYSVRGVAIWNWLGYLVSDDSRWADTLE